MSTEASSTPPPVRRVFTEEFKREAVRLATERGNISATARELGICDSVLTRWKQRVQKPTTALEATRPFPGRGNARDEEIARLKRELARSQEENAILKKAVGMESVKKSGVWPSSSGYFAEVSESALGCRVYL